MLAAIAMLGLFLIPIPFYAFDFAWRISSRSVYLARLTDRYPPVESLPDLEWLHSYHTLELRWLNQRARWVGGLKLAHHQAGLYLWAQESSPRIVAVPPLCVPWQQVHCQFSAKFGSYRARILIGGFDDQALLSISLSGTSPQDIKVLQQCAAAALMHAPPGSA